jgi:phage gp36-like protein
MILDADSLIDTYTRGRYPANIPEVDVPPFIRTISTCFAIYNLYARKLILTIPEALELKYKNAIKTLESIQKGTVTPFPSEDEPQTVVVITRPRVFTETLLGNYTC